MKEVDQVILEIRGNLIANYLRNINCEYILYNYPYLNLIFTEMLRNTLILGYVKKIEIENQIKKIETLLIEESQYLIFHIYLLLNSVFDMIRKRYEATEDYEVCFCCIKYLRVINAKIKAIENEVLGETG
jgi:hypothetical protein